MSIRSKRVTLTITITGDTQQGVSDSMQGIIDQLIVTSSVPGQGFDIVFLNEQSDEIYREDGLSIVTPAVPISDLRPRLIAQGPLTVKIENPINPSGTATITFIQQEDV